MATSSDSPPATSPSRSTEREEFADLRGLFARYQAEGERAIVLRARANMDEAVEGLKEGLVFHFSPHLVRGRPFVFQFDLIIFPIGGGERNFYLVYDGEDTIEAHDGDAEHFTIALRAPLGRIVYIICGTQRDSAVYRSRILTWWERGEIIGEGDLMLLQDMQGSFATS